MSETDICILDITHEGELLSQEEDSLHEDRTVVPALVVTYTLIIWVLGYSVSYLPDAIFLLRMLC